MVKNINILLSIAILQLSRIFKISYIFGSKFAFFSAYNIFAPLVGIFGGISFLVINTCIMTTLGAVFFGINPIFYLLYHSSNIFASAYWKSNSIIWRIILPITAMIIFIVHPAGSILYAMLWLIPIVIPFTSGNIFLKSLGATFTAHAFGSLVYLFSGAEIAWITIIPVAVLERLAFAAGIAVGYKICIRMSPLVSLYRHERILFFSSVRPDRAIANGGVRTVI